MSALQRFQDLIFCPQILNARSAAAMQVGVNEIAAKPNYRDVFAEALGRRI
jgi:hypothetical protein